jgi:hypothetical protein
LSFNDSRLLLASGSGYTRSMLHVIHSETSFFSYRNPNELAIFRTEDWKPMAICTGHSDWIFGADWVSEDVVFTCR